VAVLLGAVLVLLLAGLVGYLLMREDPGSDSGATGTSPSSEPGSTGSTGPSRAVQPAEVEPSCTGKPSRDAAGNQTTYDAKLVLDGNPATAWRCDRSGEGESLVFRFARPVHLTSVGLIPGIVKVDPADGTDRFVQNDKIAEVRWTFDDGAAEQHFEPTHDLQRASVDVTTRTVTLEIVSVTAGSDATNQQGKKLKATGKSPIAEVELRAEP
jgi:hypothetical protein